MLDAVDRRARQAAVTFLCSTIAAAILAAVIAAPAMAQARSLTQTFRGAAAPKTTPPRSGDLTSRFNQKAKPPAAPGWKGSFGPQPGGGSTFKVTPPRGGMKDSHKAPPREFKPPVATPKNAFKGASGAALAAPKAPPTFRPPTSMPSAPRPITPAFNHASKK